MLNLTSLAFSLDRNSREPLFVQLCERIRGRITDGTIAKNTPLPPSRGLAAELGISRSTVVAAYDQLVAEGYIEGRRGSGFYVRELGADAYSARRDESIREHEIAINTVPRVHSHPGFPDPRLFPYRPWARCLARSARLAPEALVQSDSPCGNRNLRASVARYLADWRGLEILPEQVLITAGSIDALETCIRTLARPGDAIGLENPGYQPLRHIVENQGMRSAWLSVDADGAQLPPASEPRPAMVVLTPSQQFPLGGAMPVSRRREYLQWAAANAAWIIEDDYDSEFRYAGRPIPVLASMDNSERTIYIGTFSKVFSVSLRLGYLIMPAAQIERFAETLSKFGLKAALPCQRALADFIDSGDFYRHIRRTRRVYADRRRLLLEQVQQKLAAFVDFDDQQAGMQVTVRLRPGFADRDVAARALKAGVNLAPLSRYYGGGDAQSGLLLGFCPYSEAEIIASVDQLAEILESFNRA